MAVDSCPYSHLALRASGLATRCLEVQKPIPPFPLPSPAHFTSTPLSSPAIGSKQRREAVTGADWRKSSLNVIIRGFLAPRGTYNLRVCTTAWREERREGTGGNSGGRGGEGAREGGRRQGQGRLEEVEDLWVLSYVLAPPDVRVVRL